MNISVYVKPNTNCEGLPLTIFEVLGEEWRGESLILPFRVGGKRRRLAAACHGGGGQRRLEFAPPPTFPAHGGRGATTIRSNPIFMPPQRRKNVLRYTRRR